MGLPFELVVFDLDGTLVDTEAWWPAVAREAVRRLGERWGRELPLPDAERAWSLVGLPDRAVFEGLLPEEDRHAWKEMRALVLPLEVEVLRGGRDFVFPGMRELCRDLREAGVPLGIASNCGRAYFEACLSGQGLGDLVDLAFCLDSGAGDKAGMCRAIRAALAPGAPEKACVLVGDRETDARAARSLGWAFLLRLGFHRRGDLGGVPSVADARELRARLLPGS